MADVFKAIADPTRREILIMLAQKKSNIGEIATQFDMSRPAIAKHVKILEQANLVDIKPDSEDTRQRNCYAQLEALQEVEAYMKQLEEFWKNRLTGLGSFLAKTKK
ncbi:MAG: winged helix-turn-helix transcriptional regulator [Bacteroidia bacterium]|nr:winged helix-turn-helix transcriptional regulator [Bacteroidia bacterium]